MTLLFLFLVLIALALAALCWGASSSDGVESAEWKRRQHWYGFH
jgi:hypothetical protein